MVRMICKLNSFLRTLVVITLAVAMVFSLSSCKKKEAPEAKKPAKKKVELTWPLSGEVLPEDKKEQSTYRPVIVKVENSPPARPQSGFNQADIVYEIEVEGSITRFDMIFQSELPEDIGPIRSARLADIYIVPQYQGIFFFSGAHYIVEQRVAQANLTDMRGFSGLYRKSSRANPHNYYLNTKDLYKGIADRGVSLPMDPAYKINHEKWTKKIIGKLFKTTQAGILTATSIEVDMTPINMLKWTYDSEQKRYLRDQNGSPFMDASGEQVRTTNLVVMEAEYIAQPNILDTAGSHEYDTTLEGSGKAYIFRDGYRIDGTWEATKTSPPIFKDAMGEEIKLAPGKKFYEIIMSGRNVRSSFSE